MKLRNLFVGATSTLALVALAASPALAQDAAQATQEESAGLGEIIVTATRRDTNLQTTAVAVSAIDSKLIQQSQPRNIGDLAAFVPNFSAATITGFNAASFAIRGVGQNNIIVYFEPPVAVLVDDFVVSSVQTQLLDAFDVDQVEVLRGPQGTLFGKNTTGGAVTVRTKRPVMNELSLQTQLQYGSFNTRRVQAAVNVPIIDDVLSLRVAGGHENSDGYYRNGACFGPVTAALVQGNTNTKFEGVSGCNDGRRLGGVDVTQFRAKLLFEPSDKFSALFQYEFLRDRSDSVPSVNENRRYTGPGGFLTDAIGAIRPNPNSSDPLDNAAITNKTDGLIKMPLGQRIDVDGFYLNMNFDVGFGTLTSVTGYRNQRSRLPNSYPGAVPLARDGEPLSIFDATRDDNRKTWQQELRLATDFEGPFNMVAGGFYQRETIDFCVAQILGFLDLTAGPLPFGNWNNTPYILCNAQRGKSYAAFAEGTYKFSDTLTLTAGIRHSWDDKTWIGRQQAFAAELNGGFDLGIRLENALDASVYRFPANTVQVEARDRSFTYRASLGWQASDSIFAYATYARGYKAGGFNDQIGSFAAFTDPNTGVTDFNAFRQAARATRPETADSYEAGVKTQFFDNRLRFNLTGFHVKYNDMQKQINVPIVVNGQPNQLTAFFNAASARVNGFELETSALLFEGFTARGVVGYLDAKYDTYNAPGAGYDLATAPLDRAPPWQWTIDGTYERDIGDKHKIVLNANLNYVSENLFTQAIDTPLGNTFLNARTLLNASVTLAEAEDKYFVRVIGRNLTDQRYRTASQNVAGLWLNSQFGPPRFVGVEVGFKLR